ncbi:prepilin-type N-terminal cleavage/methylation domain-containing protein [Bacillus sp. FJAT-47783]|uniref:type II secretion system protein n=1 Tax=Bacillus sp. FJAT-47783 TaxID=2922712 RepID=UPI001FADD412|nr:prepilin-type N-terminal cleavage/methylation domain-containing protein [Bacillus sp. FJAT-47783]
MKKQNRLNENGITLVELLATLAIFMIFVTIFYQVLNNVVETVQSRQAQEDARREANYILSALTNIHQTSDMYWIEDGMNGELNIFYIRNEETHLLEVDPAPYEAKLTITSSNNGKMKTVDMRNRDNKTIDVTLHLDYNGTGKRSDTLTIQTKISRMTEAKGGDENE